MLDGASILVTGGTGSFGKKFIEILLERYRPARVIVFSRDELKQFEMSQDPRFKRADIRFFIGDVRDKERLLLALRDVDVMIHAAALKQVPACEYNPSEAVRTNIMGAQNLIEVAIERGVKRVLALSTDKACNPINLYGATKLCSDKLFISGNHYAGKLDTRFAVVRYGNVVGSRGSVIPFFAKLRHTGTLPITHKEMTRFWITLPQAVDFVFDCLERMHGGELYVPKIPSMKIVDLAQVIAPDCKLEFVGIRPGEKLHESMISEDDGRNTLEFDDHFVVQPQFHWWSDDYGTQSGGQAVPEAFRYSSDRNDHWLSGAELLEMIQPFLSD